MKQLKNLTNQTIEIVIPKGVRSYEHVALGPRNSVIVPDESITETHRTLATRQLISIRDH